MKLSAKSKRVVFLVAILLLWGYEGWKSTGIVRRLFDVAQTPCQIPERQDIPQGVEVAVPGASLADELVDVQKTDCYSAAIMQAAADPLRSRAVVTCDISALDEFYGRNAELLLHYLACHPGWRLVSGKSGMIASRRVRNGDLWYDKDWEYFASAKSIDEDHESVEGSCKIYLNGVDFYGRRCKTGDCVKMEVKDPDDELNDLEVICEGANLSVIATEWSSFPTSRIMQVIFDQVRDEFYAIKNATGEIGVGKCLGADAMRCGAPSIDIYEDRFGGLVYRAWVNPREPGETYLKAFETLGNKRLSEFALKDATKESVGWSAVTEEKFYIGSSFGISERRGAGSCVFRLEVWFVPANGGPERKLVERVFKVKGQER